MNYPRLILAGTNSGVGKTTITLGLLSALQKRGLKVQAFKSGPDYIDPSYHTEITKTPSINLDSYLLDKNKILEIFEKHAKHADISIIEGVMGLYDGIGCSEIGSTANLSKILNAPIILILNAKSMSRSAGAIALGYKEFDKKVNIKGIILNNIGSNNHYNNIKKVIEEKTKIPVLGFLTKNDNLALSERHLGLIPASEKKISNKFINNLTALVENNIDVARTLKISDLSPKLPSFKKTVFIKTSNNNSPTIAVAKDKAFNFYYQDNLDILIHFGAKIVEFSPLKDKKLPANINGIYIGGGFPELFANKLSKNIKIKKEIYNLACAGLPIYAECGGLMYLVKNLIDFKNKKFPMVGIFNCSCNMGKKLHTLGYVEIKTIKNNILTTDENITKAHVFHWSYLDNISKDIEFAYKLNKNGLQSELDGLIKNNVLASYTHIHFASDIKLAKNFITNCSKYKKNIN